MDIRDYKTFKDDSTKELQYVIKKYNLSYSEHLILKYKESNEETTKTGKTGDALWNEIIDKSMHGRERVDELFKLDGL